MPRCAGTISSDPWFEEDRNFNCQDPPKQICQTQWWICRTGCDHGCEPCGDVVDNDVNFLLDSSIGVQLEGRRFLRAHPMLESRNALGTPEAVVRSPSRDRATRIPHTWVGLLSPCYNNKTAALGASERFFLDICSCRAATCDPEAGCPWAQGNRETCNIYLGMIWPLRTRLQIFCTGSGFPVCRDPELQRGERVCVCVDKKRNDRFEGPIRVVFQSERRDLDQAACVREGKRSCTSNLAVKCWGHVENTSRCTTHEDQDQIFPITPLRTHYGGRRGDLSWRMFQRLRVVSFSARFRDDATYVDGSTVRAKNAALSWLDSRLTGPIEVSKMTFLNSFRTGGNVDENANNAIDLFSAEQSFPSVKAAPSVGSFSGTLLKHSRHQLTSVDYVVRDWSLRMSFVPHLVKTPEGRELYPIVKAWLSMTMGVRVDDLAFEWRSKNITVGNDGGWFPSISGGDEIIYIDDQQEKIVFPPSTINVEFDLGPFSDPKWSNLITRKADACTNLFFAMDVFIGHSLFVPVFKTNQHHQSSFDVWKGGMNVGWF